MSIELNSPGYWLTRLAEAVDQGLTASNVQARRAYMDLARHYWSMHVMVNGKQDGHAADARALEFIALEPQSLDRGNGWHRPHAA